MFSKAFALLALLGSASAFAPVKVAAPTRAAIVAPSMKGDMAKVAAVAMSLAPMAAQATEGTNEILGIDTYVIPLLGLPVLLVANLAFNGWAQDQDNDDFFSELPPDPK